MPVATINAGIQDFRLTLENNVPVSTSDQLAKSTLYFTPCKGPRIALYNGATGWEVLSSAQVSLNLNTAKAGAPLDANLPHDIFAYNNAGTLTLEAAVWASTVARNAGNTPVLQDGVYVRTAATTHRYVGTIMTTAVAGVCEDSLAKRFVWNEDNRVARRLYIRNVAAHNYTTAIWQAWNNDAPNSQVAFVLGFKEDAVNIQSYHAYKNTNAGVGVYFGVGLDTVGATQSVPNFNQMKIANYIQNDVAIAGNNEPAGVGYHYCCSVEYSTATGTTSWAETAVSGEVRA